MSLPKIAKLAPQTTSLFVCDIQERFKSSIWQFPSVISVAGKMLKASKHLDIPVVVTEQYPKGLGSTVSELDISDATLCLPKTKFSMFLPEVQQVLQKHNTKSIMLLGIERMKQAGAVITTSESALFQLVQDAKHEKFKGISNLVKEYAEATKVNKLLYKHHPY
ncbi:hypothetical protein [Absidia glauca]|uniref:Isochorismatase-like domain-containing protein n=1 Tax=Absidia glauca TaxID=4829 RepID=A0A168SVV5_ABSGL|nr:hypothetical protein [Absidia glauca]